jgi:hypothetical protein
VRVLYGDADATPNTLIIEAVREALTDLFRDAGVSRPAHAYGISAV